MDFKQSLADRYTRIPKKARDGRLTELVQGGIRKMKRNRFIAVTALIIILGSVAGVKLMHAAFKASASYPPDICYRPSTIGSSTQRYGCGAIQFVI